MCISLSQSVRNCNQDLLLKSLLLNGIVWVCQWGETRICVALTNFTKPVQILNVGVDKKVEQVRIV